MLQDVDYTYDEAGNLETVTDWLTKQTVYTYDNAGNLTKTQLPNGAWTDFGYDTADRLTSVANKNSGGTISSFTYTLDAAGNRTQMVDLSGTYTYDYDDLWGAKITSVSGWVTQPATRTRGVGRPVPAEHRFARLQMSHHGAKEAQGTAPTDLTSCANRVSDVLLKGGHHTMAKNKRKNGAKRRRSKATHEELAPGTALTATLKGQTFSASVILGPEGKPEIEFAGQRYPSLSAAGKAAAGYPVNGWRFWKKVEEGDPC